MTTFTRWIITALLLTLLHGWAWVWTNLHSVCLNPPEYKETKAEKKYLDNRMKYHGVLVIEQANTGWVFYRNGKKCKL